MGSTYTLDWSETSVGPTINYGTASTIKYRIHTDVPTGVGATRSLCWAYTPDNGNDYFDLPITLDAAGTVSFYRKLTTETNFDYLRFFVDGVEQTKWSGTLDWSQVSFNLTAGSHTLRWAHTRDGSGGTPVDAVKIALLQITNVVSPPPVVSSTKTAKTYDFEDGLVPSFITGTWINSTAGVPISGTRSLRTPVAPGDNSTNSAVFTIPSLSENGVVSFDLKHDGESVDKSQILLGGAQVFTSGNLNTESAHFAYVVPASSTPAFTIRYVKDASVSSNSDATYVDNLVLPYQIDAGKNISSGLSASATLTSTLGRVNLIKNPNFEGGSKFGWNGATNSGSTAVVSTDAYFGTQCLKATATGSGLRVRGSNGSSQVSEMSPVSPSTTYVLSAYIKTSASVTVNTYVYGADSNGTPTVQFGGASVTTTAGVWQRVSTSFTVGTGERFVYPNFEVTSGGASGQTLQIDGVLLSQGTAVKGFFDGSSSATGFSYSWAGTAAQSVSYETIVPGNYVSSSLSTTVTLTSNLAYTKRIASALGGSATLTSKLNRNIKSQLSGSATLTSSLTGYQKISSPLSTTITLTSVLSGRHIDSALGGTVTLTSSLRRNIKSSLSGSVTLTSALNGYKKISSPLSTSVTLTSNLTYPKHIQSDLSAAVTLTSTFKLPKQITSKLGGEVVLYSELEYVLQPQPLAELPLGKLVRYTVNNYAVPLNPAEGSGSTPSVNATYTKGKNPEFALGEDFTVDNAAVGVYTGEIVRLSLSKKSDVATISTDTLLTKTNVDMHLYPFIDTDPGLWTAARALDYWTQQCGALYDAVDGEVSVYASGFGHTNGYALGIADSHFYDKVASGSVSTAVLNGRSVTSFGSAATTVMAQHEATQTRVPITVASNRKMVFSFGVAVRGTGRTASVTYNFIDGSEHTHAVRIEVTSAGVVTAKVAGTTVQTLTAPGPGNYRVTFSLQRMSPTATAGKLTLHSDDLDGSGALLVNSPVKVFGSTLPATLWVMSVEHASVGGSGAEMLRWGTYLSVAKYHPLTLPAVQKALGQSKKPLAYVSGFSGNVWKMLNEFCSINRLDVSFLGNRLTLGPRANGFSGSVKFSDFTVDTERREKYKQVAVVNKRSKAVTTGDAVFWRADSVFQVAAREVFETTVQTGHSILNLSQPQAVTGITPFPYKQGTGQYVVTGADGYIISPQWWADNGGKVEVSMTETEGEIAIKITAPIIDTVRAPYRISEGAGDRPALYISGSGIMNDPTELHINTGAKRAREGFDNVFESPFIATTADAFNTAARMALQYNAGMADVSFSVDNAFGVPSDLGTYPAGTVFTDNERNYKITDASQTHSQTTGNAIPFTSIAAYNASFPEGATIRDEKARHFGRTIKQVNIKPLRSNDA